MLKHRYKSKPRKHKKPKKLIATAPNQLWSWDITYLKTTVSGIYFYLYMFIDIFSRKIVGWNIYKTESATIASNLVKHICLSENINQNELFLHSDNGAPMKGATMLMTLKELGVSASFSRPSVSDDNPFSESLFKTLKYNKCFIKEPFETLAEAIENIDLFVNWYNYEHQHSAIKFVTPDQRHKKQDLDILAARDAVYKAAKERTPSRWSGNTRNWDYINLVSLNPGKSDVDLNKS